MKAIETIQTVFDLRDQKGTRIKIRSITQYSPESIAIDGVTKAIELIINRIDPLRKELAELNKKVLDADIHLKNAQTATIILDNQKKILDLAKEKINVLIEVLEKSGENLSSEMRSRLEDAITTIISSNLQIELRGERTWQNSKSEYLQ